MLTPIQGDGWRGGNDNGPGDCRRDFTAGKNIKIIAVIALFATDAWPLG